MHFFLHFFASFLGSADSRGNSSQNIFNSLISDFSTIAGKNLRLCIDLAVFNSPSHPDQTDRLLSRPTSWTCNTTHGNGEISRAVCQRTFCHLSDNRFADRAMLLKGVC